MSMETRPLMAGCCVFFIENTVCVVLPPCGNSFNYSAAKMGQETAAGEVGGEVKGQEAPQTLTKRRRISTRTICFFDIDFVKA